MEMKEKFELEYVFKTSQNILYKMLATPDGLAEWFADDVNVNDDIYIFDWAGEEVAARLIFNKKNEAIRFIWLEDEDEEMETYFEMRIQVDPMTKMTALLITDFAEPDEVEETKNLWESQVGNLMRILGA
jgi:uncharacterized protein YndB with AHSA1/START domain